MKKILFLLTFIGFFSCKNDSTKFSLLSENDFKTVKKGYEISLYTLKNKNELTAQITNYGARVVSLWVPDKNGNFADVSVGFKSINDYFKAKERFYGAVVGRYGNRIAKGLFELDGIIYTLTLNNKGNTLHGGTFGFCEMVWDAHQINDQTLELSYVSRDMEQGFPGNLVVKVIYTLTDANELKIEFFAQTDKPTVVNLTNHTFFNLKGEAKGTINDHLLWINADKYTPVDSLLIPTGQLSSVDGTPMDFRKEKNIGDSLNSKFLQLQYGKGYDHNWVLNVAKSGLTHAARLIEPKSGRTMDVFTNEIGLQFYGGNFMNGKDIGKYGQPLNYREALCLETQHFPDSPNNPSFPTTILNPNEKYYSICIYKFGTK